MQRIEFGTSGWRGLVAEDFTLPRVRAVAQAVAEHLRRSQRSDAPVLIAHDTRFLGHEFARAAAEVCAGNGLHVVLATNPLPTPALAWEILHRKASGAINITASHNPYPWNGLKFNPATAGPALPETTEAIETRANTIVDGALNEVRRADATTCARLVSEERFGDAYREQLRGLVDFDALRSAKLRVVADPLYGTSAGFLDGLLREAGLDVIAQHLEPDPYFGGGRPEPEGESLTELGTRVINEKADIGLATDCDADRFGIVDRDGTHVPANSVLALLVAYLSATRDWKDGAVARSVATTHLIDRSATAAGLDVIETPVGFKYLGKLLVEGKVRMAGEESGGFSMAGHVPEKDGVLTCLLVAEMVARRGEPLRKQLDRLYQEVGEWHSVRRDLPWSTGKDGLDTCLDKVGDNLAGRAIERVVTTDGRKFLLDDGSWVLARASGTEPIIRLYADADRKARAGELLRAFAGVLGVAV